jgi:pectate lyase
MSGGSDGGTSSGGSSSSGGNGSGGTSGDGSGSGGSGSTSGGSAGTSGSAGAGGSTTCAGFSDDFEDGNTSGWTDSGGDWTIEDDAGNAIYQGGNGNEESWAGPSCGDQAVEAKIKVEFSSSSDSYRAGIIARHAGSSSFYAFTLGGDGKLTLRRSTSMLTSSVTGTCAAVTAGIDGSEWFTLRMEVTGTPGSIHIKTFLNGTGVHDCTTTSASSAPASGPGGVMTYGTTSASFDDFSVGSP